MAAQLPVPDLEFPSSSPRIDIPAGAIFLRPGDSNRVVLIVKGLVRAYFAHPDGRETTFAYIEAGEMVGLANLWEESPLSYFAEAVEPTSIVPFEVADLLERMRVDGSFATFVAKEVARRLAHILRLVSVRTLGTMRERLLWDLLDRSRGSEGAIEATQSDLAAALGTSREVITREITRLRAQGLIRTQPGRVEIVDVGRLQALLQSFQRGD